MVWIQHFHKFIYIVVIIFWHFVIKEKEIAIETFSDNL